MSAIKRDMEDFGKNYIELPFPLNPSQLDDRFVEDVDFPAHPLSETKFEATLLGFDDHSFGYIHVVDQESWDSYANFLSMLREDYIRNGVPVPFDEINEGMFVVAKVRRASASYYVRAEVINKTLSSQRISLFNLDETVEFIVPKEQIYFANLGAQMQPLRAVKFVLEEMSLYRDTNMVQEGYQQLRNRQDSYTVEVVPSGNPNSKIKTLRLITKDGCDLTEMIRERIVASLRR